jgi:nucleotide-binding universal stress UspA family protein
MSIRRIVVPLSGVPSDGTALSAAFRIARSHGSHVDGVYLRPDPAEAIPYFGDTASASIIQDIYEATKAAADAASLLAKQALEDAARSAGAPLVQTLGPAARPSARFTDQVGSVDRVIVRKARLADLLVTANLAKSPSALAAFEAVLIGARRPVLLAPADSGAPLAANVVIAWSGSAEASYAVSCALPLLKAAKSVTILSAESALADTLPPSALAGYLALHDVRAVTAPLEIGGKAIGAALIGRTAELGGDLLVMGGYGHSRLREFILGGVTRDVIAHATCAVLMAH